MGDLPQHQILPILCSSISEWKAFSSLTHLTFWDPWLLMNHGWDHITFHLKIFRTSWLSAHSFPGFQSHADQVHGGFQTHPLFLSFIWSPPTPNNPNSNLHVFLCFFFIFPDISLGCSCDSPPTPMSACQLPSCQHGPARSHWLFLKNPTLWVFFTWDPLNNFLYF